MDESHRQIRKIKLSKYYKLLIIMLLTLVLAPGLSSCNSKLSPEIRRNEALWKSKHISNYDYRLDQSCFCPPNYKGPVDIQVRNGETTSVTYTDSGQEADEPIFADASTFANLFNVIEDAYIKKVYKLDVTYDAANGFPTRIYIDVLVGETDTPRIITITNFTVAR